MRLPVLIVLLILVFLPQRGSCQSTTTGDLEYELYLTRIATAEALLQLNKISEARAYLDACDARFRDLGWDFLDAFLDQSTQQFSKENNTSFNTIVLSPDGRLLAAGSSDSTITLYHYPAMTAHYELKGHTGSVSTLAFNDDGSRLASGGRDHQVIIWDVSSGQQMVSNSEAFSQGIYQVRFHPDGRRLGVMSWERSPTTNVMGFLKMLDVSTGAELQKIETEPHPASGVVFVHDGADAIVSTWGQITYSYHLSDGMTNWSYDLSGPEEYNSFHCIALSPDGNTIALGSTDHRIHLLSAASGQLIKRIEPWEGHSRTIKAVSFSHDGQWLASAGQDQRILIWSTADYIKTATLIGHTETVSGVCWSSDGSVLISASLDNTLRTWDRAQPFETTYDICDNGPWQTPLTADRRYFAAPCSDQNMAIYNIDTGKETVNLGMYSGLCADFSSDGKRLVTSSFDGIVRLWDVRKGHQIDTFVGHPGRVDGVAYLSAKGYVISVGDTTLRIWSVTSGLPVRIIPLPSSAFRVALSPDESHVYSGAHDGTVVCFNANTWEVTKTFKCESGLSEMAVSPDGKSLAVFSGRYLEVWDLDTGKRIHKLGGHHGSGYGIDFSPDGKYLVSGSYDQTFKLWNLESGRCILTFHGYEESIYSCKFVTAQSLLLGTSSGVMRYYDIGDK
jgi:WD40 repeat protein